MELFETEERLKEIIFELLKGGVEKSINQIHREIAERKSTKVPHRLMLTGYLQALADLGILAEKHIPPAKVYSLSPTSRRDLYSAIRKIIEQKGYERGVEIYAYILHKLFKRPVLEEELLFGNFTDFSSLKAVGLSSEERKEIVQKMGRLKYSVVAEHAFLPTKNYDKEMVEVLSALILEDYGLKSLAFDKRTKQEKLVV